MANQPGRALLRASDDSLHLARAHLRRGAGLLPAYAGDRPRAQLLRRVDRDASNSAQRAGHQHDVSLLRLHGLLDQLRAG